MTSRHIVGAFKRNMEALFVGTVRAAIFNTVICLIYGFVLCLFWRWFAVSIILRVLKKADVSITIPETMGLLLLVVCTWRLVKSFKEHFSDEPAMEEQTAEEEALANEMLHKKASLALRRALIWVSCGGAAKLLEYLFA